MHDTLDGADREFAEWYVWAKREVSSDDRVCMGAAQAAVEAEAGGADRQSAQVFARRSAMGQGLIMADRVTPRRRAYAEWYDWARREIGGDPGRLHAVTEAALGSIEGGGGPEEAAHAARSLAGGPPAVEAPPPPPPPPVAPMWETSVAPPVPPPPEPKPDARFGPRLLAYLLDAFLLLVGLALITLILYVFYIFGVAGNRSVDRLAAAEAFVITVQVFIVVLIWLYAAGLEHSTWQATVGKRAARLIVTDLAGRRIGFGRATVRYFVKAAPFVFLLGGRQLVELLPIGLTLLLFVVLALFAIAILAVEVLLALVTYRKQALHDLIAGTQVLRREEPVAGS